MIKVNVIVKDKSWFKFLKYPDTYIKKKVKKIQKDKFFKNKKYQFSLQLSGSKEIKLLNNKFRKKNKSTDVLSFPFHDKKILKKIINTKSDIYLGDIIINYKKISNFSKTIFKKHLDILWVHGLVHLFGYNHKKNKSYKKMRSIEKKFLKILNK